jgi:hypothetical protein
MTMREEMVSFSGSRSIPPGGTAAIPTANPFSFMPSKGKKGEFRSASSSTRGSSVRPIASSPTNPKNAMSTMDTEAYPSGGSVNKSTAGLYSQSKLRPKSILLPSPNAAKSEHPHEGDESARPDVETVWP